VFYFSSQHLTRKIFVQINIWQVMSGVLTHIDFHVVCLLLRSIFNRNWNMSKNGSKSKHFVAGQPEFESKDYHPQMKDGGFNVFHCNNCFLLGRKQLWTAS
jgi:hypothetical protein